MARARKVSYQNQLIQTVQERLKSDYNLDLPFSTINDLSNAKWDFLSLVMRFGERESFRDKYLGIFGVRRYKGWSRMLSGGFTEEQRTIYDTLPTKIEKLEYGNKCFEEWQLKFEYVMKKDRPVAQLNKNGKVVKEFKSVTEAAKEYKLLPINVFISCVRKVVLKYNRRFKFIHVDKEEETEGEAFNSTVL